ncbi:hypothetical protein hrd7_29680 [Leptolinea sp. HRD-7]|nr:hypothetical protein hrd7_29680 [Leptolinea sp. HRD-7]
MKPSQFTGLILIIMVLFLIMGAALYYLMSNQVSQIEDRTLGSLQQANQDISTRVARFMEPTPTIVPDPVSIIHEVRTLARLETIQYSVEKVITADSGREDLKALFGDKLLFVAHGDVTAGINLEKLGLRDVQLHGKAVTIKLPEPEVLVYRLDNQSSYVYDRQTGLLVKQDTQLETLARQKAEEEIFNSAIEDGILNQARINAEVYLDRLIRSLGYDEVIFLHDAESVD